MPQTWKTIRVFISSTFHDMHAERDHLVRFVFPRLREELLPYHIHLLDVDLRWGVTSEQDASEVCREIINECRPRFLCILGGRYGWVPAGKTRSITADEVYYGVLDYPSKNRNLAYFYFRDDSATAAMIETAPGEYREPQGSDNQNKLADLKQAILDAGFNPFTYPAQWDKQSKRLIDLKKLGDRVYDDLFNGIKSDPELRDRFTSGLVLLPSEFAEENAAMDAFVEEHSEHFVLGSREKVMNTLFAQIKAADGSYICLTGDYGSGKSALLAYLSRHASLHSQPSTLLICHFVGASPGSTDVRRTLRRLCHELKVGCPAITAELPEDPDELRVRFPDFLQQACTHQHVVIVLDAVNQFDLTLHFSGLNWLPEILPANACIILSSLYGPVLEELRRYLHHPREIELKPLTIADGEGIIEQFRKRYHKGFKPEQRAALLSKTDAGMPLYLLIALEELRTLSVSRRVTDSQDQDQAVLELIGQLPPTTHGLFKWIIERLQNDDGFRDEAGRRVGSELVLHFATLLSASRYGLSHRELGILLSTGSLQGNLPALLLLLRPYLMRRGELLDFYHSQFRAAVKEIWLGKEEQVHAAHSQLADYFRSAAELKGKQLWEQNPRLLGELPYHLAHSARETELSELFSQLTFLTARVATGQVYEQIADYSLINSPLSSTLIAWQSFLKKHAQRLNQHPNMLLALINHEGFPEARAQAVNVTWDQPWLRTSPEEMPSGKTKSTEGLRIQVTGNLEFPWGRVSAIASQRAVAFCFERLGVIRAFDLNTMRQTDATFSIRRDRPLVLACAQDATSVSIFFETGKAELYRCVYGENNWPSNLELVAEFDFQLPESGDPVVVWHKGNFWYQAAGGALAAISLDRPAAFVETLPLGQHGELSALVFSVNKRLIALRQGPDTLLLTSDALSLRRQTAHVATACACGENNVAVAFSDGVLAVFDLGDKLTTKAEVRAGMIVGALGWDGSRLLWIGENKGFSAWNLKDPLPLPVQDNQEVFPSHLNILPRLWLLQPDGSILLGTTHSIVTLRLNHGDAATDGRLEEIFGGPVWRAVWKRGKDQWLLEKQPIREVLLGREVMGRMYCAADGMGRFFAANGYGSGSVLDLSSLQSIPLQSCPPGINMAVGDDRAGCWFTDRAGDIHFIDAKGQCRCAAKIGLPDVHGSAIKNCGNHLVWFGYSSKFFQDTGAEPARTFIFFEKSRGDPPSLKRLGEQFRHPREGLCVAVCYDFYTERLVTLWAMTMDGINTYSLKVGPIDGFTRWQFQEINVNGLGQYRFVQAEQSADGQFLGVVNMAGEISCLSVSDGHVRATLAGSAPFTVVAPGADGSEFWLVEAQTRIYKCELVGGKK